MNRNALALALQLLHAACAGLAVATVSGCVCSAPTPSSFELGTEEIIHGFSLGSDDLGGIAVGSGGLVAAIGFEEPRLVQHFRPTDADLHDVSATLGETLVVGAGGTILVSGEDNSVWTPVVGFPELSADLWAIERVWLGDRGWTLVVGDQVVVVRDDAGEWSTVAPPPGGWGELRGVFEAWDRVFVVGRGGVVWSASDPTQGWVAEETGASADLIGGGWSPSFGHGDAICIVGAAGTVVVHDDEGWRDGQFGIADDIVGYDQGTFLTRGGRVFRCNPEHERLANFDGEFTAFGRWIGMIAFAEGGVVHEQPLDPICWEGRPYRVAGVRRTASATDRAWCPPATLEAPDVEAARGWLEAALTEHASVASFAQFAQQLLALAGPPELIQGAQAAALDELRHAQLCFSIAQAHGARPMGPGPLPIGTVASDRVTVAVALFEDGCFNESVAACEASVAAQGCADPGIRRALETLARDEAAHAALAWRALDWLIASSEAAVARAVWRRLHELAPPLAAVDSAPPRHDGRLAPSTRAAIRRQVYARFVWPLASGLSRSSAT